MKTGFKELNVYQIAYGQAMAIFEVSKNFPKEERYSLTDQIRRSSRSVCANIGESYRKRTYPKHFVSKLSDSDCECSETMVWLDFCKDCGYITGEKYKEIFTKYEQIGRMLASMMTNHEKFTRPKNITRPQPPPPAAGNNLND